MFEEEPEEVECGGVDTSYVIVRTLENENDKEKKKNIPKDTHTLSPSKAAHQLHL